MLPRRAARLLARVPRHTVGRSVAFTAAVRDDDTLAPPAAAPEPSPKVRALADSIAELTLLEVADLCATLKAELNIADAPVAMAAAPAAAPAAAAEEAPAEAAGPSLVKLTLTAFAGDSKVKVIKKVKEILGAADPKFNLAGAKKFVEDLPGLIKEEVPAEEAAKLKEELEAAGGTVEIA